MLGFDFHRQKPIDNYIVDFFCYDLMLVIEIDGSSHDDERIIEHDARQKKLQSLGVKFLRFDDVDVKNKMAWVLEEIEEWVKKNSSIVNTPLPPLKGGIDSLLMKDSPLKGGCRGVLKVSPHSSNPQPLS